MTHLNMLIPGALKPISDEIKDKKKIRVYLKSGLI